MGFVEFNELLWAAFRVVRVSGFVTSQHATSLREEADEQRTHARDAEKREHAAGDEDGREAGLPRKASSQDDAV